jgi:hypothetical protein
MHDRNYFSNPIARVYLKKAMQIVSLIILSVRNKKRCSSTNKRIPAILIFLNKSAQVAKPSRLVNKKRTEKQSFFYFE